jgi:chaperone BCS1
MINPFDNTMVGGGIFLMLSGATMALLRNIPNEILSRIKRRIMVSVDIEERDQAFEWLTSWLDNHPYSKKARALEVKTMHGRDDDDYPLGDGNPSNSVAAVRLLFSPAKGNHFFVHKKKLIWLGRHKEQNNNNSSSSSKETYSIRVLGRDVEIAKSIIREARDHFQELQTREVHAYIMGSSYGGSSWRRLDSYVPRPMDSVFLPKEVKERVLADAKRFFENREWYRTRGIPYRRGYLFHGLPGTGKSSLISALAGELRCPLYALSVQASGLTDEKLAEILSNLAPRCLLLLEDVDAAIKDPSRAKEDGDDKKSRGLNDSTVTFSGLLNVLDGVFASEGRLLFMTTNHKEVLDPALIRPGRVDFEVEFGHATEDQIRAMWRRFFPESSPPKKTTSWLYSRTLQ